MHGLGFRQTPCQNCREKQQLKKYIKNSKSHGFNRSIDKGYEDANTNRVVSLSPADWINSVGSTNDRNLCEMFQPECVIRASVYIHVRWVHIPVI